MLEWATTSALPVGVARMLTSDTDNRKGFVCSLRSEKLNKRSNNHHSLDVP